MKSSISEAPRLAIASYRVGGNEDLPHDGDESDLARFVMLECEAIEEGFEWGRMPDRGSCGIEERLADSWSAVAGSITALGLAALSRQWSQTGQGCDLFA